MVAVDRKYNVINEIYGNGKISTKNVKAILNGRIENKSILVADVCTAYDKFASENNFELVNIVKEHKRGIYHVNNINSYHSLLKVFLRSFKGIYTKYLRSYLAW